MRFAEAGGTTASGSVGAGFLLREPRTAGEQSRRPWKLTAEARKFQSKMALSKRLFPVLTTWWKRLQLFRGMC